MSKIDFHLSAQAKSRLAEAAIQRAASKKIVAAANQEMIVPDVVETTEDAAAVSKQLSEINRQLRAEASERNRQHPPRR
jgi:hypothetical protein